MAYFRIRNTMLLITAAVFLAGCSQHRDQISVDKPLARAVFDGKSLKLDNKVIRYAVYVPEHYDRDKAWPAIVFLNGSGQVGTDGTKQLRSEFALQVKAHPNKWPFVIIFPQKQDAHTRWWGEDAMVIAILRRTAVDYHIDMSRIYLTGHSLGGQGTWSIAANHPDLFAAIAPVSGRAHLAAARNLSAMPVWAFHGADDRTIPATETEKMAARLNKLGGFCKMTIFPHVGHNAARKAYGEENLAKWFLMYRKHESEMKTPD